MNHTKRPRILTIFLCLSLLWAGTAPVYALSAEEALSLTASHITAHVHEPQAIEGYTDKQVIDYFIDVAMHSEYEGYRGYLLRHEHNKRYCFLGDPDEADKAQVRALAEELRQIEGFPHIEEVDDPEHANIQIMFSDQKTYEDHFDLVVPPDTWGFADVRFHNAGSVRGQIVTAEIWISDEAWPRRDRNSVIAEEFIQAMGLLNDPENGYYSIFDQNRNDCDWPSQLDWALVRLLYHPSMDRLSTEAQARETAQNILDSWK